MDPHFAGFSRASRLGLLPLQHRVLGKQSLGKQGTLSCVDLRYVETLVLVGYRVVLAIADCNVWLLQA